MKLQNGLQRYINLVEKEYGNITLPKNDAEIDKVLEYLDLSLERVSEQDYHILQAMLIINNWRNIDDAIRTETTTFCE